MFVNAYKTVAKKTPEPDDMNVVQYRPAEAVRKRGDDWAYGREVWNVSVATSLALKDYGDDGREACLMRMMERGQLPRVDPTL